MKWFSKKRKEPEVEDPDLAIRTAARYRAVRNAELGFCPVEVLPAGPRIVSEHLKICAREGALTFEQAEEMHQSMAWYLTPPGLSSDWAWFMIELAKARDSADSQDMFRNAAEGAAPEADPEYQEAEQNRRRWEERLHADWQAFLRNTASLDSDLSWPTPRWFFEADDMMATVERLRLSLANAMIREDEGLYKDVNSLAAPKTEIAKALAFEYVFASRRDREEWDFFEKGVILLPRFVRSEFVETANTRPQHWDTFSEDQHKQWRRINAFLAGGVFYWSRVFQRLVWHLKWDMHQEPEPFELRTGPD